MKILTMYQEKDSRTGLLLGHEKLEKLKCSHVVVIGLGGVGGYAAEQLCRAGIGKMTIVDADVVVESNLNRQIIALHSTIGKPKTEVMKQRLLDINPELQIIEKQMFITGETAELLLRSERIDYLVDAVDTLAPKVNLIKTCLNLNIPFVSSMGAGGRFDPQKISISDIADTYNCNLARMVRKRLHKSGIRSGFKAVYSSEKIDDEHVIEEKSRNKNSNVGTISYMPGLFGLYCASVVIRDIIGIEI
jgi:tRNA A37 threonylcarbamoyladenosine dehydratase